MSIIDKAATRLEEIRAKGGQRRNGTVVGVDKDARTVDIAFSSEAEVNRWYGIEILDHSPGAVDMTRLDDGAAVLWNHLWNDQRGVVDSARIDGDRKGRATVRISRSQAGDELLNDLADGIKRHVSVGYSVEAMKLSETRSDGTDVYRITRWQPYEISFVSVPADITVGVGRSAENTEIAPEETPITAGNTGSVAIPTPSVKRTIQAMNEKILRDASGNLVRAKVDETGAIVEVLEMIERAGDAVIGAQRGGIEGERKRVSAIQDMGQRFNQRDLADKFVKEGKTVDEFQRALLDETEKRFQTPLSEQTRNSDLGLDNKEVRRFSFMKLVRALADPTDRKAQREAAFEFEVSEASRKLSGKESEHFFIPSEVLRQAVFPVANDNRAFNTGTDGSAPGDTGGYGVATNLLAGSFIDYLYNRTTIMRLGSSLGGLVGNVDIPKQTLPSQGYWLGEDQDTTETEPGLGQVSLRPKTVGAFSEITRRLLMQSSLDVEALVRRDLAIALGLTIDKAGYYGTGSDSQPLGIANTTGINAVEFATAGQPSFIELVEMETAIALDNADVPSMAYVGNAAFRGYAKSTLKFPAGVGGVQVAQGGTIWEPGNTVNGYRSEITNQIASGDVFLGNFRDLIVAMWGGLELMVDPYSNSKNGRIRIVVFQDIDFAVRRNISFCLGRH